MYTIREYFVLLSRDNSHSFTQVLNALPGAYFCSTGVSQNFFDSRVLRITNDTLYDLCDPGQSPTQQPPSPRCVQPGIPTPNNIPQPSITIMKTNTINFQRGVDEITPTYSAGLERTLNVLIETTTIVPTPSPTTVANTGSNSMIIGAVVGAVVGAAVVVVTTPVVLIIAYFCLQSAKKRGKKMNHPNVEPLLPQRPPDRPPPVFNDQESNIELNDLGPIPQPYEKVNNKLEPRYTDGPAIEKRKKEKRAAQEVLPPSVPVPVAHSPPITETQLGKSNSAYYSRPKFYKKEYVRDIGLSTSTHYYGDLGFDKSEDSTYYIDADNLEPFRSDWAKSQGNKVVTDKDLSLNEDNLQSSLAYTASELPSDLEYDTDEYTEEEVDEDEEEEEEEEETNEHEHRSLIEPEHLHQELGKSPETGQSKAHKTDEDPYYINTNRHLVEDVDSIYINTKRGKDGEMSPYVTSRTKESIRESTKRGPSGTKPKKKTRKLRRKKSSPAIAEEEQQDYTSITRDTINYTSVYASTDRIQEAILEDSEQV